MLALFDAHVIRHDDLMIFLSVSIVSDAFHCRRVFILHIIYMADMYNKYASSYHGQQLNASILIVWLVDNNNCYWFNFLFRVSKMAKHQGRSKKNVMGLWINFGRRPTLMHFRLL